MIRCAAITAFLFLLASSAWAQTWAIAKATRKGDDSVIVYRYVQQFAPGLVRAELAVRVIIVWRYSGDQGMPSVNDRTRMEALEDALAPLEEKGLSTLALVSTGNNLREWTYYVKSEDAFFRDLNLASRSKPRFPIEIHAAPDPSWESDESFVSGVVEPGLKKTK